MYLPHQKMGQYSSVGAAAGPWCGVKHPFPPSAEVKERVELYMFYPFGPSWSVVGRTSPLPCLVINIVVRNTKFVP